MSFWSAFGLSAAGGAFSAAGNVMQQRYQNDFVSNLVNQMYGNNSKLQHSKIEQEKNATMETNVQKAQIANANTPASLMKSVSQDTNSRRPSESGSSATDATLVSQIGNDKQLTTDLISQASGGSSTSA